MNMITRTNGIRLGLILTAMIGLVTANDACGQDSLIYGMRCEHLENPIGLDAEKPRFSWMLPDGVISQTHRAIVVGTDSLSVIQGIGDAWESGYVESDKVISEYAGSPLAPYTRYWWKVSAKDDKGEIFDSPVAFFETGLMNMSEWNGWWITDTKNLELRPSGAFRKDFNIHGKVVSARAYIAAAGLFELYVNGQKVGNERLEPDFTRFDRRILYLTKDVTRLIKEGNNAVGILMGNGWYNHQSVAVWDYETAPWRHRPSFCLDLRVTYEDGTVQTVISDKTWKTHLSEIVFNNIYTAEQIDNRLAVKGWSEPGFDDSDWNGVKLTVSPAKIITAQQTRPVRDVDTLKAVSVTRLTEQKYVFDFGQNISGVTELKVRGDNGTVIRLKHGEFLDKEGHVSTENIDYFYHSDTLTEPFATDIFTLNGDGEETFRQHFGYKGFRYVEVSSDRPLELDENNLVAYFVHSDIPVRGHINTSNETINKLWKASCYSYLSNLVGYPTDCPQREKNGWTGDTNAAMDLGLYNYDPITVYEKWMDDHKDAQLPNGVYPNIIPSPGWGYDWANGTDWTSTNIAVPWRIWLFYGDDHLLKSMYSNMKAYMGYIERTYPDGLTDWGLGDWIPVRSTSSVELTSSIYYYEDARMMAKIAGITGHGEDAMHYHELAERIKKRINGKYLNISTGIYASGTQTELAMPLFWNIVPEAYRQKVADNLAENVRKNGLDVGLLGSKAILGALSDNGYLDLAFNLASSSEYPSWGYWLKNGGTTFYENWDLTKIKDLSLNHMMFGEINAWFYKSLAGITPDEGNPGFYRFNVKPGFAKGLDGLEASFMSPNGEIRSGWKKKGGKLLYSLTVPSNTTAHLTLPDGVYDLTCGHYTFKIKR